MSVKVSPALGSNKQALTARANIDIMSEKMGPEYTQQTRNKSLSVRREAVKEKVEVDNDNLNKSQMVYRSPQSRMIPLAQKFSALPTAGGLDYSYMRNCNRTNISVNSGSAFGANTQTPKVGANLDRPPYKGKQANTNVKVSQSLRTIQAVKKQGSNRFNLSQQPKQHDRDASDSPEIESIGHESCDVSNQDNMLKELNEDNDDGDISPIAARKIEMTAPEHQNYMSKSQRISKTNQAEQIRKSMRSPEMEFARNTSPMAQIGQSARLNLQASVAQVTEDAIDDLDSDGPILKHMFEDGQQSMTVHYAKKPEKRLEHPKEAKHASSSIQLLGAKRVAPKKDKKQSVHGTTNVTMNGTINGTINGTMNGTINGTTNGSSIATSTQISRQKQQNSSNKASMISKASKQTAHPMQQQHASPLSSTFNSIKLMQKSSGKRVKEHE